jgi:hypothetical protein
MRLLEQFRVRSPDDQEHTVACYQDFHDGAASRAWERVDSARHYRLNGAESIECVDDDTFMTGNGVVLRRKPRSN